MNLSSLKDSFLNYCKKNNFEKNIYQLKIIDSLINFLNQSLFFNLISRFKKKKMFLSTWWCWSRQDYDPKFCL